MANTQSGKALPLVIIAAIALVAGFLVYSQINGDQMSKAQARKTPNRWSHYKRH